MKSSRVSSFLFRLLFISVISSWRAVSHEKPLRKPCCPSNNRLLDSKYSASILSRILATLVRTDIPAIVVHIVRFTFALVYWRYYWTFPFFRKRLLSQIDFIRITDEYKIPEDKFIVIKNTILSTINKISPLKRFKLSEKHEMFPWFDIELPKAGIQRDYMNKLSARTNNLADLENFKTSRDTCNKLERNKMINFFKRKTSPNVLTIGKSTLNNDHHQIR